MEYFIDGCCDSIEFVQLEKLYDIDFFIVCQWFVVDFFVYDCGCQMFVGIFFFFCNKVMKEIKDVV